MNENVVVLMYRESAPETEVNNSTTFLHRNTATIQRKENKKQQKPTTFYIIASVYANVLMYNYADSGAHSIFHAKNFT